MTGSYLDRGLGEFLDLVSNRQPAPGGGAVAAVTVSLAASLVAMAARFSAGSLDAADRLVKDTEQLRARAGALADADAEAYGAVIAAYTAIRDGDERIGKEQVRAALTHAAEVPLEVAEIGAEVARTAAVLATEGKRDVRGDAATALLLAEAATRAAAHLVEINIEAGGGDASFVRRATDSVDRAHDAAASALPE